jgi:hypothetical protein
VFVTHGTRLLSGDRGSDFLADLAGAVGLNVDQVDQMFREAAAIRS